MKRVFMFIMTLFVICGCTTQSQKQEEQSKLNANLINMEVFYHHFNEEKDNDFWLVSCYVYFKNQNIDLDNVSINIMGLDKIGKVDATLSQNPTYTSEYCQEKIFPDKDAHYITKMYIIKTDLDESIMKFDGIKADIQYDGENIQKKVGGIMEI